MPLTEEQKAFIRLKVGKLGLIEQVKLFYDRDDIVSAYAREIAERLFNMRSSLIGKGKRETESKQYSRPVSGRVKAK